MSIEKILVVGRDERLHKLASQHCEKLFSVDELENFWEMMKKVKPDLILFDGILHQQIICDYVSSLNEKEIKTPVIVVSPQKLIPNYDQLKAVGVYDCIKGDQDFDRFADIIQELENEHRDENLKKFFINGCPSNISIVGKSQATSHTLKMIRLVANSSCNPILITGETGTGKELAAQAVHALRHGNSKKFVAVNCAALTANLLESELFGHIKGSFTSADRDKTGLLEIASDGTIFLDEISEMPLDLQAKLLRVLQEKTFRKVGSTKDITCKATIIASSNRPLLKEVEKSRFRRDLYYRLAICPINIPPLRKNHRREDILLLAEYFIKKSTICPEKNGKIKGLTKLAEQALEKHHWPGNVRELKNVIDRAILLENTDKIGLNNLLLNPDDDHSDASTTGITIKDFSLEKAEKELIARALDEAGWQKTRAAALLGITRATLYAKVKQYDIKDPKNKKNLVAAG